MTTQEDDSYDYHWPYRGTGSVFQRAKLTEWIDKISFRISVRDSKYGEETIGGILFYTSAAKAIYNTRRALMAKAIVARNVC
jgi:hypothetical protein